MQYMLLIYSDPTSEPVPGSEEFGKLLGEYQAFTKEAQDAGVMVAGNALQAVTTATTVRAPVGAKPITTDGPFAET